jgi:hypothetical protein
MILDTLAWALFHTGEVDEAIVTEERALAFAVRAGLAELANYERALEQFRAARDRRGPAK